MKRPRHHDDSNIVMYKRGERLYYHPILLGQNGLDFLNSCLLTHDTRYLQLAELYARALLDQSIEVNGSLFFPYTFEFEPHGFKMKPPWYSALAQGQALSLFTRLHIHAGIDRFDIAAEKVYRSLLSLKGKGSPWVSEVDPSGYFWLIEYPSNDSCDALNGFIFALLGIYEYYLLTERDDVKRYLQAVITTIERYVDDYRNPGGPSFYCRRHKVMIKEYHMIHIDQLHKLWLITGEEFFEQKSLEFASDYSVTGAYRIALKMYHKIRGY